MNKCFAIATGRGYSFPKHMKKTDADDGIVFETTDGDPETGTLMLAQIGPEEQLVPMIMFDGLDSGICFYFETETDKGYKALDLLSLPKTVKELFDRWEGEITVYEMNMREKAGYQ